MLFFSSDTHFQHNERPDDKTGEMKGGIIRISRRPYATIAEHDEDLIRKWNERVRPGDVVWHLGDFAMGNQRNVPSLRARLNGTIHLVWGNHDKRELGPETFGCFASVQDVAIVEISRKTSVFISHYAHRTWPRAHHGRYHFYGHSHGEMPPQARSLDVGVDCWDYAPVTFAEAVERLSMLGLDDHTIRHHGRSRLE